MSKVYRYDPYSDWGHGRMQALDDGGYVLYSDFARVERERDRLKRDVEIAHRALAEAARRFAAKDMEGVRLLLCDRNARENAVALSPSPEVKS